jgi:hypothetical protein
MKKQLLLIHTVTEHHTIFTDDPDKEVNHAIQTYGHSINAIILNGKIIYTKR